MGDMGMASMLGALAIGLVSGIVPLAMLAILVLIYLKLKRIEELLTPSDQTIFDEYEE